MLVLILTVSETIAKHMENLSKFNNWYANVLGEIEFVFLHILDYENKDI